ncbi:MAG: asparagine synthase (glutamine-hydrolyzing) [Casimicrobiaceae bacterium]
MCGFFGIATADTAQLPDAGRLEESARLLFHRGPDASETLVGPGMGLAHTRLSFLDVDARANQPFRDLAGRYTLVYNGEIYNFLEIRRELEAAGVNFRTNSDTEVLLHALIRHPPERILPRLQGMFAFALHDSAENRWILARDRFGMKPLFVYDDGATLMFASEVKAMRPWRAPEPDAFSISAYLLGFGAPTKGATFYRGVRILTPGTFLEHRTGESRPAERFFALPDFWDPERCDALRALSPEDAVDRLEELLIASVSRHLIADVPVGAFCSGGVDSSLILAMAAKSHPNLAIFHANVRGRWSEHEAAANLARHLKLDMQSVDVDDDHFVASIPEVIAHYEHPFTNNPNAAPLMMVSKLARAGGVKGLLSGEGSDECFLGYPWLGRQRAVDAYLRAGRALRAMVHRIPMLGQMLWPYGGTSAAVVRSLGSRLEIEEDRAEARAAAAAMGRRRVIDRDIWTVDYLGHHLRSLLHRNDTMGMAGSIEARFPFLDHEVVAMAVNLPTRLKLRFAASALERAHPFVRDKWIVRKVADRYLPRTLSQRAKMGFWTTAFERATIRPEYFRQSFVARLFELTERQMRLAIEAAEPAMQMRLLHLDAWGSICVEGVSHPVARDRLREHVHVRPE